MILTSLQTDFLFFDLESTGLDPQVHEVIGIGALRVSADLTREKGTFVRKVHPLHPENALPSATAINGYSPERWRGAVSLHDALTDFAAFGKGCIIAAYNITFDWTFLQAALHREGMEDPFNYHRLDVFSLALARSLEEASDVRLDLESMCRKLHITVPPKPHQPLEDARAALEVFRALQRGVLKG